MKRHIKKPRQRVPSSPSLVRESLYKEGEGDGLFEFVGWGCGSVCESEYCMFGDSRRDSVERLNREI